MAHTTCSAGVASLATFLRTKRPIVPLRFFSRATRSTVRIPQACSKKTQDLAQRVPDNDFLSFRVRNYCCDTVGGNFLKFNWRLDPSFLAEKFALVSKNRAPQLIPECSTAHYGWRSPRCRNARSRGVLPCVPDAQPPLRARALPARVHGPPRAPVAVPLGGRGRHSAGDAASDALHVRLLVLPQPQ